MKEEVITIATDRLSVVGQWSRKLTSGEIKSLIDTGHQVWSKLTN